MENFGLYLGILGLVFVFSCGVMIIKGLYRKDEVHNSRIPFYTLLIFAVLPQSLYQIPGQIRKPFFIIFLTLAIICSILTTQYYEKMGHQIGKWLFLLFTIVLAIIMLMGVSGIIAITK